jgi:hypothetical protein
MFGVLGFMVPSEKPLIASLPKSSAMMKRIFGDPVFDIPVIISPSSVFFEQEKVTKTINNNKTDFIRFILYAFNFEVLPQENI